MDESVVDRWLNRHAERSGNGWGWRIRALFQLLKKAVRAAWEAVKSPVFLYNFALFGFPATVWGLVFCFITFARGGWMIWTALFYGLIPGYVAILITGVLQIDHFKPRNQEGAGFLLTAFGLLGFISYTLFAIGSIPAINPYYATNQLADRVQRYGQAVQSVRGEGRDMTRGNLVEYGGLDAGICDGVVLRGETAYRCFANTTGDTIAGENDDKKRITLSGFYTITLVENDPPILEIGRIDSTTFNLLVERLNRVERAHWTKAGHDDGREDGFLRFQSSDDPAGPGGSSQSTSSSG